MDSNALLDAYKAKLDLPSDYALMKRWKLAQGSVREMRRVGLSDERVLQIATELEIPVGEALASIRAERSKSPEVKAAWKKVAESMRSALGLAAYIAIALPLSIPPLLNHVGGFASAVILRNRRSGTLVPLLATPAP